MSIVRWIIFGTLAGIVARTVVYKSRGGLLIDIAVGICGSIIGGYFESRLALDTPGSFGVSVPNLLLSLLGAIIFLLVFNEFLSSRSKSD